jgi:hypothetical protein
MMNYLTPARLFCMGFILVATIAPAQTWTQTSAPTNNWYSIACSADGAKLFAVNQISTEAYLDPPSLSPLYLSTDSGETWQAGTTDVWWNAAWSLVICSAEGSRLVASMEFFWAPLEFSANSGADWFFGGPTNDVSSSQLPYVGPWNCLSASADGSKIFGYSYADGVMFASMDFGASWFSEDQLSPETTCIACSADGSQLIAGTFVGGLFLSHDAGTNWEPASVSDAFQWNAVASSADGSKLVAAACIVSPPETAASAGRIFTSADFGATWSMTSAPTNNWMAVASSADGRKLGAVAQYGQIYISTNAGASWSTGNSPSTNWQSIAVSADGTKFYATVAGGGIWALQAAPSPQLNISVATASTTISWIVPSINFSLQQSADLTTWSMVTNTPLLNYSNLQYRVCLPIKNPSTYFRLISLQHS